MLASGKLALVIMLAVGGSYGSPTNVPIAKEPGDWRDEVDLSEAGELEVAAARCNGEGNPSFEVQIKGCTDIIQAKRRSIVEQDPEERENRAGAHHNRGIAYYRQRMLKEALSDFDRAIALANLKPTFALRGNVYLDLRQFERAVADYDRAIAAFPERGPYYNSRCWTRAILNRDLQGALADCERAMQLNPIHAPFYLDSRAFVYFRLQNWSAVIADCDQALSSEPSLASCLFIRGLARRRLGQAGPANADIAAAMRLNPAIAQEFASYGVIDA